MHNTASTSKVLPNFIVLVVLVDDLGLVVPQRVVSSPTIVELMALLVYHHSLRACSVSLILSGWLSRALRPRDTVLVLAFVPQAVDLAHDVLLATHGWLVLARRDSRGTQGLLRAIIGVVTLLLTMEALNALVTRHIFRVKANNCVYLFLRLLFLLAVGRLVAKHTAMVADDRLIVSLWSLIAIREPSTKKRM